MRTIETICLCGGGGLGHTCAAQLSYKAHKRVTLLTGHPQAWAPDIAVHTPTGETLHGHLSYISDDPKSTVQTADLVLLCVPAFLVEKTLLQIRPYLRPETIVGAIVGNTGFFFFAHQHLPASTPLFAFQRVPYISRVIQYGKEAALLGDKDELLVATENIAEPLLFCECLTQWFQIPTRLLSSFYEVTLSNSNPILHTGRLYSLWKDWDGRPYPTCPLFYKDWDDACSALEVQMDREFFALLHALQVDTTHIDTLLEHYEATTPSQMTSKLQSIASLSTILAPMKAVEGGFVPDFQSRYFTEDFPFGLRFLHDLLHFHHLPSDAIDLVFDWGRQYC